MKRSRLSSWLLYRMVFIVAGLALFGNPARVGAISGLEGTFEFGLDAPWRLEPNRTQDGKLEYGAIPIQITIADAQHTRMDDEFRFGTQRLRVPAAVLSLGKFHSVVVTELGIGVETPPQTFPLAALHEIEVNGDWRYPTPQNPNPDDPLYDICRLWKGENPERLRDVSQTSEWHATLWYPPRSPVPGSYLVLQIEVRLVREPWPPEAPSPISDMLGSNPFITLRNYVRVHLAPEPLPRFDNRWLYGDFHYHSQGTDNEGESGYNHRGVVRAMGAMGLDFLFATDHASSSEQRVDIDLDLDLLEEALGTIGGVIGAPGGDTGDSIEEDDVDYGPDGFLRDMNTRRYAHNHGLIYSQDGANKEASFRASNFRFPQNYKSYGVVPQVFLGGEVDAIPEAKISAVGPLPSLANDLGGMIERVAWKPNDLPYGNQLRYPLMNLKSPGKELVYQLFEPVGDAYLLRDYQGVSSYDLYGREHLVYFPASSALLVGNESSFIPSNTSRFGGAQRRLDADHKGQQALLPEIERKGVAFVAHHLNGSSGTQGPDGVPWTLDHMLLKAFRSRAILGLEFWNEDARYRSKVCSHEFCRDGADGHEYLGAELGYERTENPSLFGYVPEDVRNVALPLAEYRRGFLNSDKVRQGLFELRPFDVVNGRWQRASEETEHALHQGAHDWDQLNLRGLDFEHNPELYLPQGWLKPGEPRRVFMGGGSDAHGDLNYRRAGYLLGTEDANDTAIGKPRNLVFVGAPEGAVVYVEKPVAEDPTRVGGTSLTQGRTHAGLQLVRRPPGADDPPIDDNPVFERPVRDPNLEPPVQGDPVVDPPPPTVPGTRIPGDVLPPDTNPPVLEPTPPPPPPSLPPTKIPIGDIGGGLESVEIRAHSQEQIIAALRRGCFCVTDGPALRIAIDLNGNQQIDDDDVQMGGFYSFDRKTELGQRPVRGQKLTLLAEVISTTEFGPITRVDLYVGAHPGTTPSAPGVLPEPRVYAPEAHGVRSRLDPRGILPTGGSDLDRRLVDGYWQDNRLRFTPPPGAEFHYTAAAVLDLDSFEAGSGVLADRFFVRAFAATRGDPAVDLPDRYAFSNPIWLRRNESVGGVLEPIDPGQLVSPTIRAVLNANRELVITFTGICTFTPRLGEPFQDLPDAVSPYTVSAEKWSGFFRARQPSP